MSSRGLNTSGSSPAPLQVAAELNSNSIKKKKKDLVPHVSSFFKKSSVFQTWESRFIHHGAGAKPFSTFQSTSAEIKEVWVDIRSVWDSLVRAGISVLVCESGSGKPSTCSVCVCVSSVCTKQCLSHSTSEVQSSSITLSSPIWNYIKKRRKKPVCVCVHACSWRWR